LASASLISLLVRNKRKRKRKRTCTTSTGTCSTDDGRAAAPTRTDADDSTTDQTQSNTTNEIDPPREDWSEHLPSHIRREQMKEKRRIEKIPLLAMKTQMYDNITMLDPHGQALSKISRKKARWYVNKGLADYKENNEDIQLRFEPKARSEDEHGYGKSVKKNICVACGGEENHMRFYIVPYPYRCLFPQRYKSHISHDVVLLCADCHLRCAHQSQLRMNEMEDRYMPEARYETDHELYKVRSSALALMNWRHQIPEEKIAFHESTVRAYFEKEGEPVKEAEELSKEQLQKAIDIDYRIENPKFVSGPELVVNAILNDDETMAEFVRDWRRHFLDTLHPRHLPSGWSVNHPVMSS